MYGAGPAGYIEQVKHGRSGVLLLLAVNKS
jgi:hypothetical protein